MFACNRAHENVMILQAMESQLSGPDDRAGQRRTAQDRKPKDGNPWGLPDLGFGGRIWL